MNTVILMRHVKSTKGTEVYQEIDKSGNIVKGDNALVGTLYIRRATLWRENSFDKEIPQELKVTITSEGETQ